MNFLILEVFLYLNSKVSQITEQLLYFAQNKLLSGKEIFAVFDLKWWLIWWLIEVNWQLQRKVLEKSKCNGGINFGSMTWQFQELDANMIKLWKEYC